MAEEPAGLSMAKWVVENWGVRVIPAYCSMKTADKYPLVKNWVSAGSREVVVLEQWWRERPYAFPGLLGGKESGLLVIDGDGPEAVEWLRSLVVRTGGLGEGVFCARTPGRGEGIHLYFRWPSWMADLGQAKVREEGWRGECQLRGRGTWTLMPGSRRPDGEYEVLQAPEKLEEASQEFVEAFLAEAAVTEYSGLGGDLRELSPEQAWAGAPWVDQRKNAVAGLAWHQSIRGAEYEEVLGLCNRFAVECCEPSLETSVVQRKVDYTWQRANAAREKLANEAKGYQELAQRLFG